MSIYSYHTLQHPANGFYKEKGSKFLAFAYPVDSEADIKTRLDHVKKEYFDARHHCFAWMLGADKKYFRAFDDGEPSHSAGTPILGQIRSKGITNILIVVVRYFGGIKLGVGGLMEAYKAAAEDALRNGSIVEIELTETIWLQFEYTMLADMMKIIKDFGLKILEQDFSERGTMKISIPLRRKEKLLDKFTLLNALGRR
ncbi:MAG TPA: YigZ family protein, partial [Chryseolinea sp.]|nr:YigZ family protein [Chryseolinea sp.]